MKQYDVAAFVWPSYTGDDPRTRIFWPQGIGEWESVLSAKPKFPGHKWPRRPLWGYVNEADPYVMEAQIRAALDHGIDTFIYDWYWFDNRPFLEGCLNDGFLGARNNEQMKFYLMWANHNADYLWDKRNSDRDLRAEISSSADTTLLSGTVSREQFEAAANRMIERYFWRPNYYRIDGKPVLMLYCLPLLVKGLGGIPETRAALDWFRNRCAEAGLGGLHMQLDVDGFNYEVYENGRQLTIAEIAEKLGFESMTNYQMKNFAEGLHIGYEKVADQAEETWYKLAKENPIPYFPQVSVGWDNNARFHGSKPILEGSCPEQLERALTKAKAFADAHPNQPPLITINSWNEWTEGSYLQPDDIYGYGWLDAVKNVFGACHYLDTN